MLFTFKTKLHSCYPLFALLLVWNHCIADKSISVYKPREIPDQVWNIDFRGNDTFSDVVLEERIATEAPSFFGKLKFWKRTGHPLNEMEVRKDVIRISNYYQRRGFSQVNVKYRIEDENKVWKKKVIFFINENAAIRIRKMTFKFETKNDFKDQIQKSSEFKKTRSKLAYQVGDRYETIHEPDVKGTVSDLLKNLGYAFAKVNILAKVDTALLAADLTFQCTTGPRTYIDSIDVEGTETISSRYVIRQSGLYIGERYSLDNLQEAQQELFNHHLFRFATINLPDQAQDSTLSLLIRVRENPLRSVQASVGVGTEEYVRGQLSWTHRNAFHKGHKFTATARASFIEQSLSLDYLFPYIYNPKSSIVLSPFGQHLLEKSFELYQGGITNSFIYRYSKSVTASASYQFTKNLELSKQTDASLPDTTLAYDLSSIQLSGYYNEGLSRRQQGWVIQPYAEISGFLGFATFQFQKLSVDIRRYLQLSKSTTFASRVQMGGLFNVSTDSLPNNIRFFLGGTNSVRGWYRQELGPKRARVDSSGFVEYIPVGGRSMFSFNAEIRQDLTKLIKGFGIAVFLDGGQVWQNMASVGNRPIQFGAGGGVRYQSPIGPLRVDIGYKLNPTDEDLNIYQGENYGSAWNRIGIHFSIGQAF